MPKKLNSGQRRDDFGRKGRKTPKTRIFSLWAKALWDACSALLQTCRRPTENTGIFAKLLRKFAKTSARVTGVVRSVARDSARVNSRISCHRKAYNSCIDKRLGLETLAVFGVT